jgi:hypothetical protein
MYLELWQLASVPAVSTTAPNSPGLKLIDDLVRTTPTDGHHRRTSGGPTK